MRESLWLAGEKKKSEIRLKVMRLISDNPEMSTRQVDKVAISNGTAYYVITALIEKGFVKLGNFKIIRVNVSMFIY